MDLATLSYYSRNAHELAQRYENIQSPLSSSFSRVFPAGGRVLDIGCGSGRDLAELHRHGYQPFGVDATPQFAELAQRAHPELARRVKYGALPELGVPFGGNFDSVLCSAVLMHIETTNLRNAALAIKKCLKPNGRLLISIPKHRRDIDDRERDANGRLFKAHTPEHLQLIFEQLEFSMVDQWENIDAMNRDGFSWITVDFRNDTGTLSG